MKDRLRMKVLYLIQSKPRMAITEICRALNNRFKYYCGLRNCFANNNKKKLRMTFPCVCTHKREKVRRMLRAMETQELIIIRREKKADGKMKRKWDFMKCML